MKLVLPVIADHFQRLKDVSTDLIDEVYYVVEIVWFRDRLVVCAIRQFTPEYLAGFAFCKQGFHV